MSRLLHRGGQGSVYRAVQLSTGRDVAVKVLPGGPHASEIERRRFEREADIGALLDHPNIVALIDRGVSDGHPFFVMRFVEGEDLDAWVERARPSWRERLDLFLACCDAVTHAHARGVIHRDLKPSNIRVDRAGQPHVVDFGLAKTLPLGMGFDASSLTLDGHFVGTLAFAAPEQLLGDHAQVDARTDVHALGLILYWLLTGRPAHPVTHDVAEALQHVRATEPVPPSRIVPKIDDELDTIVLKALAKEKDRRYATVDAFATDLRRHLAGEPIEARRDSRWYVLRKTARRYRLALGVLAAFIVLLGAAIVAVWVQRNEALRQEARAREEAERARVEAQSAQRVTDVMVELFRLPEGQTDGAESFRVLDALEKGAHESLPKLDADPIVKARLEAALARSFMALGRHEEARPLAEESYRIFRELGVRDREFVRVATAVGFQLKVRGHLDEAIVCYQEAVDAARGNVEMPPQALPATMDNLARMLERTGRSDAAREMLEEALAIARSTLPQDDRVTLDLISDASEIYGRHGRLAEGEALRDQALAAFRAKHGDTHVSIANLLFHWSVIHQDVGQLETAEQEILEALRIYAVVHREANSETAEARTCLGSIRFRQGRLDEAEALFKQSLAETRASSGEATAAIAQGLVNLAEVEEARGPGPRACAAWRDVVAWHEKHPVNPEQLASAQARLSAAEQARAH